MECIACHAENDPADAFCGECGVPFIRRCSQCDAVLKPDKKFCTKCGAAVGAPTAAPAIPNRRVVDYTPKHLAERILQSKSALEGERKQVTVLFADIQGSMQLAAQLDPEQWHVLLDRYFGILTDSVHRYEGTVNQYTGDGVMALFGAPIAHEDHAQRACYAALQARDLLRAFADELRLSHGLSLGFRFGLNSGDVVVGKIGDDLRMDYTAQGATVGIAQRIEQLAAPGHAVISGATERLVAGYFGLRALGKTDLKGLTEALPLFELQGVGVARTRLEAAISRGLSRFVGRVTEMETLQAALTHAQQGHGQVIGIVGEPGLGKSRLCFEFVAHCRRQGVPVFEAHCPAHGRNVPYLPILELFRHYFAIGAQDDPHASRQRIAGAMVLLDPTLQESLPVLFEFMGVSDPKRPMPPMDAEAKHRQLYDMIHRISRAHDAQGQLTVTLIDDLHWIDPGSDAFVAQLANAVVGRRSLLVLNFRPEYVAAFANKPHYQQLPLVPLGEAATQELVTELIGSDPSVNLLSAQMLRWTSGNPFYVEELVNALAESGDLMGYRGAYRLVTPIEHLEVPSNVRSVLAARIDRLPESAKRLLQTAAVIGKEFTGPLLDAISDLSPVDKAAALERLKSGDFIYERVLYPVFEYAFKHPLTHEVAYQSQLQSRRKVAHASVARALEASAGDKLDELAAQLAHHYEAAGEATSAAHWHRRAAEWVGLSDIRAAFRHWQRVRDLIGGPGEDEALNALLVTACSRALTFSWRLGSSETEWSSIFNEGCAAADRMGDLRALAMLNTSYSAARGLNLGIARDYVHYAAEGLKIADQTSDVALRVATRALYSYALIYSGQLEHAERVSLEAIDLAGSDANLGAVYVGFSPLLAARHVCAHCAGYLRDPGFLVTESPRIREFAIQSGFPEQASWVTVSELEIKFGAGDFRDFRALAQTATQLATGLGETTEIMAAYSMCQSAACEGDWPVALELATEALKRIQTNGAMRLWEPNFLALIGTAEYELGNPTASRAAASQGIQFMRNSGCYFNPRAYAVLIRAQLALTEPAGDIAQVLDEYGEVLSRTGFRLLDGEYHELRADLALHEGRLEDRTRALSEAHACYARFGMAAQAERVERRRSGSGL